VLGQAFNKGHRIRADGAVLKVARHIEHGMIRDVAESGQSLRTRQTHPADLAAKGVRNRQLPGVPTNDRLLPLLCKLPSQLLSDQLSVGLCRHKAPYELPHTAGQLGFTCSVQQLTDPQPPSHDF
jgi:hypothetical protein